MTSGPARGSGFARGLPPMALATLMLLATLPACSLGAKQDQANRIMGSLERLRAGGVARGEAAWSFRVIEVPGTLAVTLRDAGAPPALDFGLVADVLRRRAQFGPPDATPIVIFDRDVVYAERAGTEGGLSSRDWARLDFSEVERFSSPSVESVLTNAGTPTAALLNPVHVLELVSGTLTGSVKRIGSAEVSGQRATRYRANLSFDKAESELRLTEPERDARRRVLKALAVKGDTVTADVWIGDDGTLRRIAATFVQKPAPRTKLTFTVRLDIADLANATAPNVPARKETLRVDTTTELVRGLRKTALTSPPPSGDG